MGHSSLTVGQEERQAAALLQVCQEAARAAWPTIAGAGAPGKAGPELQRTDSARGEPAFQGMRLSAKLGDAGPQELAGSALREGMQRMLGGEGSTPGLQASVRPGCVHLVVDTLTFWVRPTIFSHEVRVCSASHEVDGVALRVRPPSRHPCQSFTRCTARQVAFVFLHGYSQLQGG